MKPTAIAIGALTLLLLSACSDRQTVSRSTSTQPAGTTVATTTSPEDLGQIGAEIKARPAEAKDILSRHGMTEESFEQAIRTVSSDPGLSRRYAAAYNKASV